jgi:hypothetical protein
MKMRHKKSGEVLNVREFIITKGNLWEYYVLDENEKDDDIQFCLVRGFEQELGDVYMPEIKPYISVRVKVTEKNYHEIMPAIGYEWVIG